MLFPMSFAWTREYTAGPVNFDASGGSLPRWFQVVGSGTVVIVNEDGTTGTFVCVGGEVLTGAFRSLTSMTCTRLRFGTADPPVSSVAPADVALQSAGLADFGDGSDGSLVFDGTSVVAGLTPSSSVYTMTRDIFATTMSIAAGVTVKAVGFRVFAQTSLTIVATGVLHNNGNAAAAGVAGAVTNAAGSLGVGTAGGAGGAGNNAGAAGTANASGFPGGTGVGGVGGGDGTHTAAAAGAFTALAAAKGGARNLFALQAGMIFGTQTNSTASLVSLISGGTGGGGGGGDNADATGGGGGGGGGVLVVSAKTVANAGKISCDGGAGAAGTSAANNAGGGGGGGGGVAIVIARSYSGAGALTCAGGASGAKAGASGVAGTAGVAGVVVQVAA